MTADEALERWLSQFFERLEFAVCIICGAMVAGQYRERHAAFHGKRQK
jgi:hypothetical protein